MRLEKRLTNCKHYTKEKNKWINSKDSDALLIEETRKSSGRTVSFHALFVNNI